MQMYYGEVSCPHCQKLNKALVDNAVEPDAFYVLGDAVQKEVTLTEENVWCEYCYQPFPLAVTVEDGIFKGFNNGKTARCSENTRAETTAVTWQTPFSKHPYPLHHLIEETDGKWTVECIYKKEYTERDEVKRMSYDFLDSYYYLVANPKGEQRWCEVRDYDGENARLSAEKPFLYEGETLTDVSESLFKSHLLFRQEMGMQYDLEAYQHQHGIQLMVMRKEEDERVCVLDLFGDDINALVARTEELLYARD